MGKIRFYITLLIARLIYLAIKLLNKSSGTSFVGMVSLKLCPKFLTYCKKYIKKSTVAVTGTNGKTTTSGMLAHIFGYNNNVIHNAKGANMLTGVANMFALKIKPFKNFDYAVIESDEAYLKGLEIISFMNKKTKEMEKKYNIHLKLEETPAESTAGRFAKLDIKRYGDKAFHKENEFGVYYTNSIHFATDSDVDYITRLQKQSKFHTLVEAGSMIHIWGGEYNPDPKAIYKLLEDTWYKTKCVQWVLSPEYT
ncbi:hypothetical protein IJO12_07880, partial [bacterium]|nr:hypothetical protein [bacterium]